jgi:hypothetical protein
MAGGLEPVDLRRVAWEGLLLVESAERLSIDHVRYGSQPFPGTEHWWIELRRKAAFHVRRIKRLLLDGDFGLLDLDDSEVAAVRRLYASLADHLSIREFESTTPADFRAFFHTELYTHETIERIQEAGESEWETPERNRCCESEECVSRLAAAVNSVAAFVLPEGVRIATDLELARFDEDGESDEARQLFEMQNRARQLLEWRRAQPIEESLAVAPAPSLLVQTPRVPKVGSTCEANIPPPGPEWNGQDATWQGYDSSHTENYPGGEPLRDVWIYVQRNSGKTNDQIVMMLERANPKWSFLEGHDSIRKAAKRAAAFFRWTYESKRAGRPTKRK